MCFLNCIWVQSILDISWMLVEYLRCMTFITEWKFHLENYKHSVCINPVSCLVSRRRAENAEPPNERAAELKSLPKRDCKEGEGDRKRREFYTVVRGSWNESRPPPSLLLRIQPTLLRGWRVAQWSMYVSVCHGILDNLMDSPDSRNHHIRRGGGGSWF